MQDQTLRKNRDEPRMPIGSGSGSGCVCAVECGVDVMYVYRFSFWTVVIEWFYISMLIQKMLSFYIMNVKNIYFWIKNDLLIKKSFLDWELMLCITLYNM